jgi:hypothetical protein
MAIGTGASAPAKDDREGISEPAKSRFTQRAELERRTSQSEEQTLVLILVKLEIDNRIQQFRLRFDEQLFHASQHSSTIVVIRRVR